MELWITVETRPRNGVVDAAFFFGFFLIVGVIIGER